MAAPFRRAAEVTSFHVVPRRCSRANNRPDVFAAQRRRQPTRHESVHDLHVLEVARSP
jgi:hypothetical protein